MAKRGGAGGAGGLGHFDEGITDSSQPHRAERLALGQRRPDGDDEAVGIKPARLG